ncbi:DUF3558 domain-containing protein [Nocardia sp. NPDC051321]|uniref:DUF3558 domain-containing protein n=1 Tax=Nocardia sp. NPDC051321 TaxID=3364323 RepID=UPI0037AEA0DA
MSAAEGRGRGGNIIDLGAADPVSSDRKRADVVDVASQAISPTRPRRLAAIGASAVCTSALILTGCTNTGGDRATVSSSSASSSRVESAKFDPCTDIPQSVLSAEGLENRGPENSKNSSTTWTGCGYQVSDGYDARIVTTNLTLDQIKAKYPDTYRERVFGSRRAAFYTLFPSLGSTSCVLNVELASGTLEFDLSNQKSAKKTGQLDTCGLLTNLAEQVVAAIPPRA